MKHPVCTIKVKHSLSPWLCLWPIHPQRLYISALMGTVILFYNNLLVHSIWYIGPFSREQTLQKLKRFALNLALKKKNIKFNLLADILKNNSNIAVILLQPIDLSLILLFWTPTKDYTGFYLLLVNDYWMLLNWMF